MIGGDGTILSGTETGGCQGRLTEELGARGRVNHRRRLGVGTEEESRSSVDASACPPNFRQKATIRLPQLAHRLAGMHQEASGEGRIVDARNHIRQMVRMCRRGFGGAGEGGHEGMRSDRRRGRKELTSLLPPFARGSARQASSTEGARSAAAACSKQTSSQELVLPVTTPSGGPLVSQKAAAGLLAPGEVAALTYFALSTRGYKTLET